MWRSLIALLASLTAEPGAVDREHPRAAAACQAAYAAMARDDAPPAPKPVDECLCGQTCVRGVWKPDGRIEAKCECQCARCKAERAKGCPTGKCPTPGASPATVSPARPSGGR